MITLSTTRRCPDGSLTQKLFDEPKSHNIEWEYDPSTFSLWLWMDIRPRPCYTIEMIYETNAAEYMLINGNGKVEIEGKKLPIWHYVIASRTPGIFNLGGDLKYFIDCVNAVDTDGLAKYGARCNYGIEQRWKMFTKMDIITWGFVDGEALGGGFETILSLDFIASTKNSTFGFPESRFGLWPGMGGFPMMAKRVSNQKVQEAFLSGCSYQAWEMLECGIIDHLVENKEDFIETLNKVNKKINTYRGLAYSKKITNPVSRQMLDDMVDYWAKCAVNLSQRDLKLMKKIVSAQSCMNDIR